MKLNKYGRICFVVWNDLINHYSGIQLDEFVIMPNHIHGIIVIRSVTVVDAIHELHLPRNNNGNNELHLPRNNNGNNELHLPRDNNDNRIKRRKMLLPKIIGRYKMQTAKQINKLRNLSGQPFWQRNYYERIIRNEDELYRTRKYILYNPQNWDVDKNCDANIL